MRNTFSNTPIGKREAVRVAATIVVGFLLCFGCIVSNLYLMDREMYRQYMMEEPLTMVYMGLTLFFFYALYFIYLRFTQPTVIKSRKQMLLISVALVFCFLINLCFGDLAGVYCRPYALFTLLLCLTVSKRVGVAGGLFLTLTTFLHDYLLSGLQLEGMTETAGLLLGVFNCTLMGSFIGYSYRRVKVVLLAVFVGIPAGVLLCLYQGVFGIALYENLIDCAIAVGATAISVLLFLAFLPVFERCFNVITVYRLSELTDHRRVLMQRLRSEAPGTFQHTLMVANLAEACALAIGEDPALCRVCAYYHDIGKLQNPEYFTENQKNGNPHDQLTPELSTNLIKKHTTDGYRLAKAYHLPDEVADVIVQHHGTMPIKYFYYKAMKFSETGLSMENFCYDGPKPQTAVAANIMICDASEAAVRSMKDKSSGKVEELVRSLIEERMDLEQFSECDVTMRDLYLIKDAIVSNYEGFYHERIAYPKFKMTREAPGEERAED